MGKAYGVNTEVEWDWGEGKGKGKVRKVYKEKVTKTIKGTDVTRDADEDDPAYLVEQDDGDEVLKSHSELSKAS